MLLYLSEGICICGADFWKKKMLVKQSEYEFSEGGLEESSISEVKIKSFLGVGQWFLFQDTFAIKDVQK